MLQMSNLSKWEWFTFKLKQIAIETGKEISQIRKCKQKEIIEKIMLCNNSELSIEGKGELHSLQIQLDDLYMNKANGAFIRSRARWLEQGEKHSAYFLDQKNAGKAKKRFLNRRKMT